MEDRDNCPIKTQNGILASKCHSHSRLSFSGGKRSCCRLEPRARPTDTWQRPSKRRRVLATNDDDDDKKSLTTLLYVVLKYHTSRCHRDTSIGAAAHQCGIMLM